MLRTKDEICRFFTPLGTIKEKHVVGPYFILEYLTKNVASREIKFRVYIATGEGQGYYDTKADFSSLDQALAHAIAFRAEGPGTRADVYFIRGLRADVSFARGTMATA